jgi:GTP-binding protein
MKYFEVDFLGSFEHVTQCPSSELPEFAFFGRSNVGKSSLINSLLHRKNIARTSNTPGKTQHINLYEVDKSWMFTDLPGYGFAKISKIQRKKWEQMIEKYLLQRANLICTFLLIDSRHPLQKIDAEMMAWLADRHVPFVLVYTKIDKQKATEVDGQIEIIRQGILENWEAIPQEFITSSEKFFGMEEIHTFIAGFQNKE